MLKYIKTIKDAADKTVTQTIHVDKALGHHFNLFSFVNIISKYRIIGFLFLNYI